MENSGPGQASGLQALVCSFEVVAEGAVVRAGVTKPL